MRLLVGESDNATAEDVEAQVGRRAVGRRVAMAAAPCSETLRACQIYEPERARSADDVVPTVSGLACPGALLESEGEDGVRAGRVTVYAGARRLPKRRLPARTIERRTLTE